MWFSNSVLLYADENRILLSVILLVPLLFYHLQSRSSSPDSDTNGSVKSSSCLPEIEHLLLLMAKKKQVASFHLSYICQSCRTHFWSPASVWCIWRELWSAAVSVCGAVGGFLLVSRKFCRMDDTSCSKLLFLLLWNITSLWGIAASVKSYRAAVEEVQRSKNVQKYWFWRSYWWDHRSKNAQHSNRPCLKCVAKVSVIIIFYVLSVGTGQPACRGHQHQHQRTQTRFTIWRRPRGPVCRWKSMDPWARTCFVFLRYKHLHEHDILKVFGSQRLWLKALPHPLMLHTQAHELLSLLEAYDVAIWLAC